MTRIRDDGHVLIDVCREDGKHEEIDLTELIRNEALDAMQDHLYEYHPLD